MSKKLLLERFQELAGIKSLYELDPRRPKDKEFDDAQAMGRLTPDDREKLKMTQQMMDKEKDIESPFPGTDDDVSNGYKAAQALKDELRYVTYKKLSDEELNTFSKEMVLHFLENTTAAAAAKIYFGKREL